MEKLGSLTTENWLSVGILILAFLTLIINVLISWIQIRAGLKSIKIQIKSTAKIAQQQINKDIKSSNRMIWISDLRNSVSEYISNHEYIKLTSQNDSTPNVRIPTKEWKDGFKKWNELGYKIELLLNPNEQNSIKLIKLMTNLNQATDYHSKSKEAQYEVIKGEILIITKIILKQEWERVKSLE